MLPPTKQTATRECMADPLKDEGANAVSAAIKKAGQEMEIAFNNLICV